VKTKMETEKRRHIACLGFLALALGIGYAGIRTRRSALARRWREYTRCIPTRTALVTGASAGIGKAYALRLAELGYRLVIVARRAERLEALAEECRLRFHVTVEPLSADLSTEEGIARVEQRLHVDDIHFLVNNAGYDVFGDFSRIPIEESLGLIRCLELATVRLTHAALPGMLKYQHGAVVNVSSIGAFSPKRKDGIYVASKAFVNRFTESLALDLSGSGVRVQALCPGFTITEFHDAPEYAPYHIKERIPGWLWMKPDQVVQSSLQALSEGQVVCVPGFKNQMIAAALHIGLSQFLMHILSGFFPEVHRAWMQPESALELLACPACRGGLVLAGTYQEGALVCPACQKKYPIAGGIPCFAAYDELTGMNRRFAGMYDRFSIFYRQFSRAAFALIGTREDQARGEILDRLAPYGKVLEVSIGPGVNLPYLREHPEVNEIYGLDLSNGQLARCRNYALQNNWPVALYQGNAESLPFQDQVFDSILHIGGINFFNDKKKAIAEMIRVAKPGAKIVICDETERGARGYELLPGFRCLFQQQREVVKPPIDLVPPEMVEVKLDETVWKGWFYCLEFRKPGVG
jgi:short-subunit dehydrogenase/ubiquinone/menaquinone biosynthesis C-methylase UbiE/uncharacterized protein YbaR (Trm112 family)